MARPHLRATAWPAILLASAIGLASPPAARSEPQPTCTFSADIVLDPGLSSAPSTGRFESAGGETGTYRCDGPFGSERTGAAGARGRYGTTDADSCAEGGEGDGTLRVGGAGGAFTFTYSEFDADGVARGTFDSDRFEGTFSLTSKDGDCAVERVTKMRLDGRGTVKP